MTAAAAVPTPDALARAARRLWARVAPADLAAAPDPHLLGQPERGRAILRGTFRMAGHLVEAPGVVPWDIEALPPALATALHGFDWLDDLATLGETDARQRAQGWVLDWLRRHGAGGAPKLALPLVWNADQVARRLVRLVQHAAFLDPGLDDDDRALLARGRTAAAEVLRLVPLPAASVEVLSARVQAAVFLPGPGALDERRTAARALAARVMALEGPEGGLRSRNPEALLGVFCRVAAAEAALALDGGSPVTELRRALERIAPDLRMLRHADGGLARFHGGGRGADGAFDLALVAAELPPGVMAGAAMGFRRLAAARTTVIVDAAAPPAGADGAAAHASTLAFEMTSGRRPLIVSCGGGGAYGVHWQRVARTTEAHSTLSLAAVSSSGLGAAGAAPDAAATGFVRMPRTVTCEQPDEALGPALALSHDGWAASHGLTHLRRLELSPDGRMLAGEDTLAALSAADRARLSAVLAARGGALPFALRFHLHPDADAELDLGGTAVSVSLRSGEVWIFREAAARPLALEPSVYLEPGLPAPRATWQIVVPGALRDGPVTLRWTLAKAQQTPVAVRDDADLDGPDAV